MVYVLLLGLELTISRLVSMHFVLCCSLRILEDMSLLSFLRILILLEEPPHLTADHIQMLIFTTTGLMPLVPSTSQSPPSVTSEIDGNHLPMSCRLNESAESGCTPVALSGSLLCGLQISRRGRLLVFWRQSQSSCLPLSFQFQYYPRRWVVFTDS